MNMFNIFSKSKSSAVQPKRDESSFIERQTVAPNPHKVTREDLLCMTRKERMALIVEIKAINKGMTVAEFNEEIDKGRALKYGVDYKRWQGMSEQERTVLKARANAAKKGMTLEEAKADYDSRMSDRCGSLLRNGRRCRVTTRLTFCGRRKSSVLQWDVRNEMRQEVGPHVSFPDCPKSPNQKYRLTRKGLALARKHR